jgi:hypothetical protein
VREPHGFKPCQRSVHQGSYALSQDPTEPPDDALQAIDRYIEVSPTPRSGTETSQPQPIPQRLSPSQRLQALGQQRAGTFTSLLDFQNAQTVQEITTPLLPNEF